MIVFDSSPLIFLSQLNVLELFLNCADQCYLPAAVLQEINVKEDKAKESIQTLVAEKKLQVKQIKLAFLESQLRERLGKGEAETIALGIELNSDYVILDNFAARKEAFRLGLRVKGTLAILKKLHTDGVITTK